MNIVLYGATGNAGSRILTELLSRGHKVKAIVRDPQKLTPAAALTAEPGDLSKAEAIAHAAQGVDAVISAYAPPANDVDQLIAVTERLIAGVGQSPHTRLLVVGGAGSLEVSPGVALIDSGHLPEAWKPIALAHGKALDTLRASSIDWTCLCPAAYFEPGARTGKFRLAKDELLMNDQFESRISMEDYAIAMVDELEKPQHRRERFTVGY